MHATFLFLLAACLVATLLAAGHGDDHHHTTPKYGCRMQIDECKRRFMDMMNDVGGLERYKMCVWEAKCETKEDQDFRWKVHQQIDDAINQVRQWQGEPHHNYATSIYQLPSAIALTVVTVLARWLVQH